MDGLNYILGTQSIGPAYGFTDDSELVETALGIEEMGSNILKIALSPSLYDLTDSAHLEYDYVGMLSQDPSFKRVLEMDFDHYFFWVERAGVFIDGDGLTEAEAQAEYQVHRQLADYLLTTFEGTGKTFYIGSWEADWHLVNENWNWDVFRSDVPQDRIDGMIDWLNIRQQAIDDAKGVHGTDGVNLFHYVEVNLVETAMDGLPRIANEILPHVNVDLVSYSAYDVTADLDSYETMKLELTATLDYLEQQLQPKDGLPFEKRVFIGEFGYPFGRGEAWRNDPETAEEQAARSLDFLRVSLEWGTPFALYWQFYDNEISSDGSYNGFWMVDNEGVEQPIYEIYEEFYDQSDAWVQAFVETNGRNPTEEEFRSKSVAVLTEMREEIGHSWG